MEERDVNSTRYHRYFPDPLVAKPLSAAIPAPEALPRALVCRSGVLQDDIDFGPLFSPGAFGTFEATGATAEAQVQLIADRTLSWLEDVESGTPASQEDILSQDLNENESWTKVQRSSNQRGRTLSGAKLSPPVTVPESKVWNQGSNLKDGVAQDEQQRSGTEEVNSHIHERFKVRASIEAERQPGPSSAPPTSLTSASIRRYFQDLAQLGRPDHWSALPEVPTPEEVMLVDPQSTIPVNKIQGQWESKDEYLAAHYELVRADTIYPLRTAIQQLRVNPGEKEAFFDGSIGIYERVGITGVTCDLRGIAHRVAFSLGRVGKRVRWEQSKRLISGTLVALTPSVDMFKTKCIMAIVAARPLSNLNQSPPEIDLYFARPQDLEIDPAMEWVMVEDRGAYFEANRHVLCSLQKLATEGQHFPLQKYLVGVEQHISSPNYLQQDPCMNVSKAFSASAELSLQETDVLNDWPVKAETTLDESQMEALKTILTKELAIVQGPPGTGKTHVSVVALQVMLDNWHPGDPPIIVSCQTNHALDQLLRHVAVFEKDFVRLGGRSKDKDVVKERTIFNVRSNMKGKRSNHLHVIKRSLDVHAEDIKTLLSPLHNRPVDPLDRTADDLLDHATFRAFGLLTDKQCQSLDDGDQDYVHSDDEHQAPLRRWLGSQLLHVRREWEPDNFGYDFEEADLDFEQLQDIEAEAQVEDDEDQFERLRGMFVGISDTYSGRQRPGFTTTECANLLQKHQDLWKIPPKSRGSVFCYLQRELKSIILEKFRKIAAEYDHTAKERGIAGLERDFAVIKGLKLVGLTTTGLAKYRPLISALSPKIVLIEEAAETIEAPITAVCVPSLQHLVLVGDHQQLRPQTSVRAFQARPFYLNVSLFERMVINEVSFSVLQRQRRMIPEIRRLLRPIYGDAIYDHESVKDPKQRSPIPGMGGMNSFFFTHEWPESFDDNNSAINTMEAAMVVMFFEYLVLNDVDHDRITVLTFYNGQRKAIHRGLIRRPALQGRTFRVCTVDSYQGEENDIVLLSLVRSNDSYNIGFLNVSNRVCVALSRAKRGFYMFGNAELLCTESKLWHDVIQILRAMTKDVEWPSRKPRRRIGFLLPLTCQKHNRKTFVERPDEFDNIPGGGCEIFCKDVLTCGHACNHSCHAFEHHAIVCDKPCERKHGCGHPCNGVCGEECSSICEPCQTIHKQAQQSHRNGTELPIRSLANDLEVVPRQDAALKKRAIFESNISGCDGNDSASSAASKWRNFATERIPHLQQRMEQEQQFLRANSSYNGVKAKLRSSIKGVNCAMDDREDSGGPGIRSNIQEQSMRKTALTNEQRCDDMPKEQCYEGVDCACKDRSKVSSKEKAQGDNALKNSGSTAPEDLGDLIELF